MILLKTKNTLFIYKVYSGNLKLKLNLFEVFACTQNWTNLDV